MTLARSFRFLFVAAFVAAATVAAPGPGHAAPPAWGGGGGQPDLGGNVMVFDPSMPISQIQARSTRSRPSRSATSSGPAVRAAVPARQLRHADAPLNFQVGYYTSVAGLGALPGDVVINGSVYAAISATRTAPAPR